MFREFFILITVCYLALACGNADTNQTRLKDLGTHSDQKLWLEKKQARFYEHFFSRAIDQRVMILFDSSRFYTATATLIDQEGMLLTNYHVLSHCIKSLKRDRKRWHEDYFSRLEWPRNSVRLKNQQKCPFIYAIDPKKWNEKIARCFNGLEYLRSLFTQKNISECRVNRDKIISIYQFEKSCPKEITELPTWIRHCRKPEKHVVEFWARKSAFRALEKNSIAFYDVHIISNYDIYYSYDKSEDELKKDKGVPTSEQVDKLTGFEAVVARAQGYNSLSYFSMYKASSLTPDQFFKQRVFAMGYPVKKGYSPSLLENRTKAQGLEVEDFSSLTLNLTTGVINTVNETFNLDSKTIIREESKPYDGLDGAQGFSGAAVMTNEDEPSLVGIMSLTSINDPDKDSDIDFAPGSVIVPSYRIINHYFKRITSDQDAAILIDNLLVKEDLPEVLVGFDLKLEAQSNKADDLGPALDSVQAQ